MSIKIWIPYATGHFSDLSEHIRIWLVRGMVAFLDRLYVLLLSSL